MSGTTFTDATVASSGVSSPPTSWALVPGTRHLKGWLRELAPVGKETQGVTQAELTGCEEYAWQILLSRFVANYDISEWSQSPPQPLFQIWDLLASSYVLRFVGSRVNTDKNDVDETIKDLLNVAGSMIRNIIDPEKEGDRQHLFNQNGQVAPRRSNAAFPVVINPKGTIFFPTFNGGTDAFGVRHDAQSVETFIAQRTRRTPG